MLRLFETVGPNQASREDDVVNLKRSLMSFGAYKPNPRLGLHGWYDTELREGLTRFQRERDLLPDGVVKPNGPTIAALRQSERSSKPAHESSAVDRRRIQARGREALGEALESGRKAFEGAWGPFAASAYRERAPRHPGEGRVGASQDRALTIGKARVSVRATNEKNRQRGKAKREANEHRIRLINQARIASTRELRAKDIAVKRQMGILSAKKARDELAKIENHRSNVTIMDLENPNNNDFIRKFLFGFQGNK